ncbi:MAG: glycosyltransferase family 39 protein [Aquificae bacterium]|nr:glycosyltransferase family 39 protein [Aquificota bacterium]
MKIPPRDLFLLTLSGLYFFVFGNWILSLTSPDEGRNAYAALHMLETGNFLVPYYNCEYRFAKPPLLYWLTALSFSLFGVNEFAARLVSGLAALGTALLVYLLVRDFVSRERALTGALVFTLLVHTWFEARALVPEMLLVFFSTLGVYLFLKGRKVWGWAALGLAFLTKGPVGVGLPLLVLFFWKLAQLRRPKETLLWTLRLLDPKGILVFLLVGFWWYAAMLHHFGWEYFYRFFVWENLGRLTGKLSEHNYPLWYYLPFLLLSTVLFWPVLYGAVRKVKENLPPFAWFTAVFAFYTLARSKLHHYLLFSYPGLAAFLAPFVGRGYLRAAALSGVLLLALLLLGAKAYEEQRFTPKAVSVLKEEKPERLYFYRVENSALVFYLYRCIPFLERPSEAEPGSWIVTDEKGLRAFKNYEVVVKGREFEGEQFLIVLRGDD